ncbi:MAG: hypothetical protein CMM76_01505 [Rhodospirillaceae bacterium]|nr:hypothetical protein [Rhodospirillaceae bacterium]|tara:strand:+ start:420 stop:1385 length:966 start_codon:yes stop_codon:yes gene_type:complete
MHWQIPAFIGATLLSWVLTKLVLAQLKSRAILDCPNQRSSHKIPTPRGGGIAVITVVILCWAYPASHSPLLLAILAGAMLLALVSWLDDLRSLSIVIRLCAQFLAVGVTMTFLSNEGFLLQGLAPVWLDRLITFLVWVWFINLFNFMDGIDGIATVETLVISSGLALLFSSTALIDLDLWLPVGLVSAALGFLWWNWYPAKVFLGDVGSIPLGFLLGGLLIFVALKGFWAPALILPLYFLCDATVTLIRRSLNRQPIWQAHRQHFYQTAVQSGKTHAAVSTSVFLAGILLIATSHWSLEEPWFALAIAFVIVAFLLRWMSR